MTDSIQLRWWVNGSAEVTDVAGITATETAGSLPTLGADDLDRLLPVEGDHLTERLMWALCVESGATPGRALELGASDIIRRRGVVEPAAHLVDEGIRWGSDLARRLGELPESSGLLFAGLTRSVVDVVGTGTATDVASEPALPPETPPVGIPAATQPPPVAPPPLPEPGQISLFAPRLLETPEVPVLARTTAGVLGDLRFPSARRGYGHIEVAERLRDVGTDLSGHAAIGPTGGLLPIDRDGADPRAVERALTVARWAADAIRSDSDPFGPGARVVETAEALRRRTLRRALRGYRRSSVDAALAEMIDAVAQLERGLRPEAHPALALTTTFESRLRGYRPDDVEGLLADVAWSWLYRLGELPAEETPPARPVSRRRRRGRIAELLVAQLTLF